MRLSHLTALAAASVALAAPAAAAAAPGDLDTSFAAPDGFMHPAASGNAEDLLLDPQGRILVPLGHDSADDDGQLRLARVLPDGRLDPEFNAGGATPGIAALNVVVGNPIEAARAVVRQPDGKLVVGGDADGRFALARFHENGTVDDTFNDSLATTPPGSVVTNLPSGLSGERIDALELEPDGEIVAAGISRNDQNDVRVALARYTPGGARDSADFNDADSNTPGGTAVHQLPGGNETVEEIERDPADGSIVVAGATTSGDLSQFFATRIEESGAVRGSFGGGDGVFTLNAGSAALSDGAFGLLRLADGRLVLAGGIDFLDGTGDTALLRLTAAGELDPSFAEGGVRRVSLAGVDLAGDVAALPDGRLVVTGLAGDSLDAANVLVARFGADGALDTGFADGGRRIRSLTPGGDAGLKVALRPDGGAVVAGVAHTDPKSRPFVARFEGGDLPGPAETGPAPGDAPATPAGGPVGGPAGPGGAPQAPTADPAPALTAAKAIRRRGRSAVRFRLSEGASVRIVVTRGRRRVATLTRPLAAGQRTVALRAARRPGRYRVTLTATDAAGQRSKPVSVTVRVGRGAK